MRKADLLAHFGGTLATAKALNITRSAVAQWRDIVPERIAWRVQFMTGGVLQANPADYGKPAAHEETPA